MTCRGKGSLEQKGKEGERQEELWAWGQGK